MVKSFSECSPWSILQYFWPALSINWSWKPIFGLFESDHFTLVLLYSCESVLVWVNKSVSFWLKYNLDINYTSILAIQFYFTFYLSKLITAHFSIIRFYFYPIKHPIDTRSRQQNEKLAFLLKMNNTEPFIVTATNSNLGENCIQNFIWGGIWSDIQWEI